MYLELTLPIHSLMEDTMSFNWKDLISDASFQDVEDDLDYTRRSAHDFKNIIWEEAFEDNDSKVIFEYLYNQIRIVSFSDYLKRYVYEKAELDEPFKEVDDKTYKDIIIGSFKDTCTPKSFRQTTSKIPALVGNWLHQDSVSRETVFLLGFGLSMPVEDVSYFLTKAIREQDFNFNNPEEVVYWFCLKNHYGASKAILLLKDYERLTPDKTLLESTFIEGTVSDRKSVV